MLRRPCVAGIGEDGSLRTPFVVTLYGKPRTEEAAQHVIIGMRVIAGVDVVFMFLRSGVSGVDVGCMKIF